MEGWEKVRAILQSRKFWVLVIAIVGILAALATGKIGTWEAVQAFVAALAAYSTGIAIEDAGAKIGGVSMSQEKLTTETRRAQRKEEE